MFLPYNNTTRGQLTKIVVLGYSFALYTPPMPTFNDVNTNNPFYVYIETAYHFNLVSGYVCGNPGEPCPGLYFGPNALVTRGQLCKITVLAAGWEILHPSVPDFNDVPPTNPFYDYVETGYCHQMVSGYACGNPGEPCPGLYFRPFANGTRGQICKIVFNAILNLSCNPPPQP